MAQNLTIDMHLNLLLKHKTIKIVHQMLSIHSEKILNTLIKKGRQYSTKNTSMYISTNRPEELNTRNVFHWMT